MEKAKHIWTAYKDYSSARPLSTVGFSVSTNDKAFKTRVSLLFITTISLFLIVGVSRVIIALLILKFFFKRGITNSLSVNLLAGGLYDHSKLLWFYSSRSRYSLRVVNVARANHNNPVSIQRDLQKKKKTRQQSSRWGKKTPLESTVNGIPRVYRT